MSGVLRGRKITEGMDLGSADLVPWQNGDPSEYAPFMSATPVHAPVAGLSTMHPR